jgi:chromosome segregation ATPase
MIKSLIIQNIQSHKRTELEFDQGVNVIVGLTDSGKSTIIRAIKWLAKNRPSGDSIRSNWGGESEVCIRTEETRIIRRRSNRENCYIKDRQKFEALKTEVPIEIQNALNISDINIQQQLNSPFLLSETPGEVAQHFNRVAKLNKIDSGLQNVQKEINELNSIIGKEATKDKPATGLIKQLKDNEEALQGYLHLDKFEAEVEVLEGMENALHSKERSLLKLKATINDYEATVETIEDFETILVDEEKVNKILSWVDEREELKSKLEKIFRWIRTIKLDQIEIARLVSLEIDLQKKFDREMGKVCVLCGQPIKK